MTAVQLRTTMRVLVLVTVVALPLVFWRGVADPFETTKATTLWCLGTVTLAVVAMYLWAEGHRAVPRAVTLATATLLAALTLATVTSMSPISSVIGQPTRYAGLGTWLCITALFLAACLSFDLHRARTLAWVCTLVALPVTNYAALQVSGHDPFAWSTSSFNNVWVSTFSNPNLGAAFVAIVLPLIAVTMLRPDAPRWVALLGAFAFGACTACLAVFSSFQGPVAALTTVAFLVARAAWLRATLGEWLVSMGLAAMVLVVPSLTPSAALIVASGCVAAALLVVHPVVSRLRAPTSWHTHRRHIVLGAAVSVSVLTIVSARRIARYVEQGWSSGFLERGDFYRSAATIFKANPVVGSGLETFGMLFAQVRPASHAVRFERWISTSAHSVPIGMFANGGIVLGLAYLAFVGVIGWMLLRTLRSTTSQARVLVGAVGAAWLAFQVQSLVSVENVTLFTFHLVLSGLVVALAVEAGVVRVSLRSGALQPAARRSTDEPTVSLEVEVRELTAVGVAAHHGSVVADEPIGGGNPPDVSGAGVPDDDPSVGARRIAPWLAVVSLALCGAVVATVCLRPLRAEAAARAALVAATETGDVDRARAEFRRAIELAPWVPDHRVLLAHLEFALGNDATALTLIEPVLTMPTGLPLLLEHAAVVARDAGDDVLSLEFVERSIAVNPNGPELRSRAATFYVEAGERAAAAGQIDLARSRLQRALELEPGLQAAEQALDRL